MEWRYRRFVSSSCELFRENPALDHHLICYCPSGSARLVQGRNGLIHEGVISAGVSLLMPAGYDSTWGGRYGSVSTTAHPTSLIVSAGEQIARRDTTQIEIRNVFETRDSVIEGVAQILLAELERKPHPAQALIVRPGFCRPRSAPATELQRVWAY